MSTVQPMTTSSGPPPKAQEQKRRATFICSRSTIDGAYPPLLLAINARRLGLDATIFFTFQGLELVRKGGPERSRFVPQGFMGAIPGMSRFATFLMKRKIDQAQIPNVAELMEMAPLEGVKLVACKMTLDMFGWKPAELIDGVAVQTAEEYMKYARTCEMNMFT